MQMQLYTFFLGRIHARLFLHRHDVKRPNGNLVLIFVIGRVAAHQQRHTLFDCAVLFFFFFVREDF